MNVGANQHHKKIGTDAADAQPHQLHEDLDSDDSDSFTDDSSTISKSISTNESSNSLSGPVTDLWIKKFLKKKENEKKKRNTIWT